MTSTNTTNTAMFRLIPSTSDFRFSLAPMVDVTTVHFRYLAHLLSRRAVLYSEMVVDEVMLRAKPSVVRHALDEKSTDEGAPNRVVLQLASKDPNKLAAVVRMALTRPARVFDEINLNCGCPAPRATSGSFGASLMKQPDLVRRMLYEANRECASLDFPPLTVKCRLGVDDLDTYEHVAGFLNNVQLGGSNRVILHARKCHLKGLNPKANRTVPKLNYDYVFRLKRDFPDLKIEINGGIETFHGEGGVSRFTPALVDGIMIGRAIWKNPLLLARVDELFEGGEEAGRERRMTRRNILERYRDHFEPLYAAEDEEGNPPNEDETEYRYRFHSLQRILEPILTLFHGTSEARKFRRLVSDEMTGARKLKKHDGLVEVFDRVMGGVSEDVLDAPLFSTTGEGGWSELLSASAAS